MNIFIPSRFVSYNIEEYQNVLSCVDVDVGVDVDAALNKARGRHPCPKG